MNHSLMPMLAFVQSYDRDCLDLQQDTIEYIKQLEAEFEDQYPDFVFFDRFNNRVWPVTLLKAHFGITGEPLWSEQLAAS